MGTNRRGLFIPTVTLAMAGLLAATGCSNEVPSDATASDATAVITAPIDVAHAVPITVGVGIDSAADRVEHVALGSTVKLTLLDPEQAEQYFVDGYALGKDVQVAKGIPEIFQFVADKPGTFALRSQTTQTVLLTLQVG
ncbi:MAG: hypothetical protein JWN62_710 [Acidimicrobiales bacterium]|nr:hypothetical protein [Acidimicrobiales bacterium]